MRNRRVRRMDGINEEVTKPVGVSKLIEPSFLTLTGKPANQVAFKIIRDDQSGEVDMTEKAPVAEATRRRRIRSTQRSSLLFIEFPEGATDEDVAKIAEDYGLDGYEITQTSDGRKCLKRSDLDEIPTDAVTVLIGDGKKAGVLRADTPAFASADPLPYIEVVGIEFDNTKFDGEAAVMAYLKRFDIDFLEKGVENTDKLIRVMRSEFAPNAEIRRVEVETGVVAVVTRAAVQDVTLVASPFTEVVCEECYGQWGWGQLDFAASLADVEFCEAADEATYHLRGLMERILFYSQLPVAARKELVNRAATQFASYIGALLDGLPSKVVLVNRSNLETLKEKKSMVAKTNDTAPAETSTEASVVAAPAAPETPITRSEIAELITASIAAALAPKETPAPVVTEEVTRTDDATQGEDAAGKVLASVEAVVKTVEGLATSLQSVTQRLDTMAGATTLRSDGSDSVVAAPKADVFQGIFSAGRTK